MSNLMKDLATHGIHLLEFVAVASLGPIIWGYSPEYFKPSPEYFRPEKGGVYSKITDLIPPREGE